MRPLRYGKSAVACVCVFVSGVVVPLVLLSWTPQVERARFSQDSFLDPSFYSTKRRSLSDYDGDKLTAQELHYQVDELKRIKVSVRNELRTLERDRLETIEKFEKQKKLLETIIQDIDMAKKELLVVKAGLLRISNEVYLSKRDKLGEKQDPKEAAPPIIILPPSSTNSYDTSDPPSQVHQSHEHRKCSYAHCFDLSHCSLALPFKVFVYSHSIQYNLPHPLSHPEAVENFIGFLKESNSLATRPIDACVFLVVLGPMDSTLDVEPSVIEQLLYSLPYWNGDGHNHIVVSLLDSKSTRDALSAVNTMKSVAVRNIFSHDRSHRMDYDILAPPLPTIDHFTWKSFPIQVPAHRKYHLYFVGERKPHRDKHGVIQQQLQQLARALDKESVHIKTECGLEEKVRTISGGDWMLCGTSTSRSDSLTISTFAIIPSGESSHGTAVYTRLSEALSEGAIPVIVGITVLPFETVVDWSLAAVIVPLGRFHEIHLLTRTLTSDKILQMRRQGRFIWETYFNSTLNILKSVVSIVRHKLLYSPPPAQSFKPALLLSVPGSAAIINSPSFTTNHSYNSYYHFNNPPGPFHMYPSTPWQAHPVSGSQFSSMTTSQLKGLPPHVISAAGITGPYFEKYLLGNNAEEHFTIVMLTYKRNDVMIEALEQLNGLRYLAKVIIVWNNPEELPADLKWPKISAPIEVVRAAGNSLNNRFLPLSNIETEAILSIDDDVYLRHDEIQLAFRVWRESRDKLVGFPARFHAYDVHHRNWLYNANHTCEFSMVLTGAAFFHKYYSYLYTQWMTQEVREMVDQYMNCEDIAMNFLVSHITRKPPIKVTSRWTFHCPGCPQMLSQSDEHFTERHHCINLLTRLYGYMPLLYTQYRADSVLFKTRLPSHLEKCYQYV